MNILFWFLVVWAMAKIIGCLINLGWTDGQNIDTDLWKLSKVGNLIFLSLLLIYLFNLP